MKINKYTYIILWISLVVTVIFISNFKRMNNPNNQLGENTNTFISTQTDITLTADSNIKGAWISYISLSNHDKTEESFKSMFLSYVKKAQSLGITDLFVHTRAFSDALYDSEYFPWSHLLTGTQGKDPNYDPLEYMIETTHSYGLKFHAWINPMRVKLTSIPSNLSTNNPYNVYSGEKPFYFFEKDGVVYINPAYKEMRNLIAKGASEIVKNYDVDGIHFDDYFYPQDMGELDKSAYDLYCQSVSYPISIQKWRESNINAMISQVYREIKLADEDVVFGISPQGNDKNNLSLGANTQTWCSVNGYIDYICPQIYFSYDNPSLGFEECLNYWINIPKHENLKLYIGLASYKVGTDSDLGTWQNDDTILSRQMSESLEKANGYVLFELLNS